MSGRVGLGFSGLGWLGESLIKELPSFPRLHLAAAQDVDPKRAAEIAARYGSPWHGADYRALLSAPDVEVAVICTPNTFHTPQARAALKAGKHVLVQKPLALSLPDARATLDLAAQVGRLLFVDYSYRYLDTVQVLREALPGIGPPRRVIGAFHNIYGPGSDWFFEPRLSGGGALVDLGVHILDLALELLHPTSQGLEEVELFSTHSHPVEDAANLLLRLDQAPFNLEVSWNARRSLSEIFLEMEAERGHLRWENVDGSFFRFRTLKNGGSLIERETTLRQDTLRAFVEALETGAAPRVNLEVYDLLQQAYARGTDVSRE